MAWKTYNCEIMGRPAFVLIDQRFQATCPIPELSQVLWIGVYCDQPADGAFSPSAETVALDEIEADLLKLGQAFGYGWLVYVLRIDTPGVREYYFYYGKQAAPDKMISALIALHPKYRIESGTKGDDAWAEYGKYVSFDSNAIPNK